MASKIGYQKMTAIALVVSIFAIAVAGLTLLQVAIGQTPGFIGPDEDPPPVGNATGAISFDGSLLTIDSPTEITGILDMLDHRITNVPDPSDGADAVNRDWVLAQGGPGSADGEYYELYCPWNVSQSNVGYPPGQFTGTGTCTPALPDCLPDDVDRGVTSITTAYSLAFSPDELFSFYENAFGFQRRLCFDPAE